MRALRRTPGFTAIAVATLALGIGINTLVFTVYSSVAFRRLPVRAPEEMVRMERQDGGSARDQFLWSEYEWLAARTHTFVALLASSTPQTLVCTFPDAKDASVEVVKVRTVSANYFEALGIRPSIGRSFGAEERGVTVVSYEFWKRKLNGDPAIYGKTLTLQGTSLSVVGVAPEQFAGTGAPPQAPDLWVPASADAARQAGARDWQVLARRESDKGLGQVQAELAVLSAQWPPEAGKHIQLKAVAAAFFETGGGAFQGFAAVCGVLAVAVALVLLMGCINLVNLIETRNWGRAHEIAVRLALGASRWRLLRQFCTESLLLGLMGGTAGLFLSVWGCDWLSAKTMTLVDQIANGAVGFSLDLSPDWRVLSWTAALSVITGIAVGILPALRASVGDVSATLKHGSGTRHPGARRKRNLLLTAQVASCLILLAAAGLLFRGAARSASVSAGFEWKHLVMVGMDTHAIAGFTRIAALPQIESAAWADRAPFLGTGSGPFRNEDGVLLGCIFNGVSDTYFQTLGIPLLAGRTFTQLELERQEPVAVVSQATAARLWPGKDPLGRTITPAVDWLGGEVGRKSLTVIGVSKTVRSTYLSKEDEGYVYMPRRLRDAGALLLLRTRGAPERAFLPLSAALSSVNADLAGRSFMFSLQQGPVRLQELMAEAPAVTAAVLGILALTLACLGIYGVVSHLVSQRTREIGIRVALGADWPDVVELMASQTLPPVAYGAGVGLVGALGVSGLLRALIVMPDAPDLTYGAGAFDPITFLGLILSLGAVVSIAAFFPMRRALHVHPAVALRDE
jgi:predicted permease